MIHLKIKEDISIASLPEELISQIIQENTFKNPAYSYNAENGYSNWNTKKTIETYSLENGVLSLPRGYLPQLIELFEEYDIEPNIEDLRTEYFVSYSDLKDVTLRDYQHEAAMETFCENEGVIVAPTGSGKTFIGLEIIRINFQRSLILVHRSELAKQWESVIKERLGIVPGFIGEGRWEIGEQITVAMIQTLDSRQEETKKLSDTFGLILCDEVHHAPAYTCFNVLGKFSAMYRYGLSATPCRRDGLEMMIYRAVGPVISEIGREEVEEVGATVPAIVQTIETGFDPGIVNSWGEYVDSLSVNANRNLLIVDLAESEDSTLILCDRVGHAEQLSTMLTHRGIDHVLAHGKISKKDRDSLIERIGNSSLTVGTASLLGEGLDIAHWSTLIMATPISSETKLLQAIGRVVRAAPGKTSALVYDLRDDCGLSGASFKKRKEIYRKHNIWVEFNENKKTARG